jgi:hypothetical protein
MGAAAAHAVRDANLGARGRIGAFLVFAADRRPTPPRRLGFETHVA